MFLVCLERAPYFFAPVNGLALLMLFFSVHGPRSKLVSQIGEWSLFFLRLPVILHAVMAEE